MEKKKTQFTKTKAKHKKTDQNNDGESTALSESTRFLRSKNLRHFLGHSFQGAAVVQQKFTLHRNIALI